MQHRYTTSNCPQKDHRRNSCLAPVRLRCRRAGVCFCEYVKKAENGYIHLAFFWGFDLFRLVDKKTFGLLQRWNATRDIGQTPIDDISLMKRHTKKRPIRGVFCAFLLTKTSYIWYDKHNSMLEECAVLGKVIFVTAFKGGVGKTTVSAGIAAALASLGKRVCVVDADFGMRCMDLVLGVADLVVYDCMDVLAGRCRPSDAIVPVAGRENLSFMPAPIRYDGSPFPHGKPEELFAYLREEYDYCIVDSSAELSEYYRRFAVQADEAVVVSLHQSTAIRAAEKTAANLAQFGHSRVHLVVNGYRAARVKDGSLPAVLDMIRRSSIPLMGVIPMSDELSPRQEKGIVPLGGKERERLLPYEVAFLNIAVRLCGGYIPLLKGVEKPGRKKTCLTSVRAVLPGVTPRHT